MRLGVLAVRLPWVDSIRHVHIPIRLLEASETIGIGVDEWNGMAAEIDHDWMLEEAVDPLWEFALLVQKSIQDLVNESHSPLQEV